MNSIGVVVAGWSVADQPVDADEVASVVEDHHDHHDPAQEIDGPEA
jgi:hypothetical protein